MKLSDFRRVGKLREQRRDVIRLMAASVTDSEVYVSAALMADGVALKIAEPFGGALKVALAERLAAIDAELAALGVTVDEFAAAAAA